MKIIQEQIDTALKRVMDPEVDLDIFTMGLIYETEVQKDGSIYVLHTLTSPACPLGPEIQRRIREELMKLGATDVEIELTFDPPWKAPKELRDMLGI